MQEADEVAVIFQIEDFDFSVIVFGYEHVPSVL